MSAPPLDRSLFPVTAHHTFLNHAGVTPLPQPAVDEITRCAADFAQHGSAALDPWELQQEAARASGARLLGAKGPHEVALVKNTTEGLSFVANGLSWRSGDRVIVPDREFPSSIYPWLSLGDLGVEVAVIDPHGSGWTLPLDRFEAELRRRPTRLVAVSWVQYARGWRTDLGALATLCHEHGALLCVDVIQGLGLLPCELEAWGVDFAAADAHKWLLGPLGVGLFYVAERNLDLLRPLEPGWASVVHRDDYDNLELIYDVDARRFEGGSYNNITIAGMGTSFDLLHAAGVDHVWRHVDHLLDVLVEGLDGTAFEVSSDRSPCGRSGIVTVTAPHLDPAWAVDRLAEQGIVVAARGGGIRISPHGYNTVDEIDTVLHALRHLTR